VFGVRDIPVRLFARSLAAAFAIVLLAGEAAWAACTPKADDNVTANGFSIAATFEGEFSDVTESYAGEGVVRYAW
jgi:hypothetical protein